jgi:dsRNA-specific ribonuclease
MNDPFLEFVLRTLRPAINEGFVQRITAPTPLRDYFRAAFTHITFVSDVAASEGVMDYDVLEKIGDKVAGAAFLLYIFEIIGNEVRAPQVFADLEKYLVAKTFLANMAVKMGFDQYLKVAEGVVVTTKMKSDLFESFTGAIVIAADRYIPEAPGIGFVLAKAWLYQVFNTHMRSEIDPINPGRYVDFRTQVNEIWLFNGWGEQDYRTSGERKGMRQNNVKIESGATLVAPTVKSFPAELRGKVLGNGTGPTLDAAREMAAEKALETLRLNFAEFKDSEVQFSGLTAARIKKALAFDPALYARVEAVLLAKPNTYRALSVRKVRIYNQWHVQIRVKTEDGIWETGERHYSYTSEEDAYRGVFERFLEKASK